MYKCIMQLLCYIKVEEVKHPSTCFNGCFLRFNYHQIAFAAGGMAIE